MKPEETISKLVNSVMILTAVVLVLIGIITYLSFHQQTHEQEQEIDIVDYYESPYDIDNKSDYRNAANYIGQDFNPENGEVLTKTHCLSCHKLTDYKLIGPPLHGLKDRLPGGENWLIDFLTNSDSLYNSGDPYVIDLRQEYKLADWNHELGNLRKEELIDIAGFIMMSK